MFIGKQPPSTLADTLEVSNITDGYDIIVSTNDVLTADVINETTANAGVTVDGVTIKDGLVDGRDPSADGIVLDGLAAGGGGGGGSYTHPANHLPSIISQDATNRFVTDAEKATWNAKADTKADVGLGNADNTSDANKPVSTATQAALNLKTDSTRVLTDVPANAVFTDTVYTHPTNHAISVVTGLQAALDAKAALASPSLSGTPTAPTATAGTNTTQVATTQFVATAVGSGGGAQTGAQIKTAYEAEADTNAFNDAAVTKLGTIEASADVTDTTNVVAALTAGTNVAIAANGTISSTDTNTTYTVGDNGLTQKNFTTALDTKLGAIEASADVTDTTNVVAALTAGANVAIAANGTISSTDTNTTYTVGDNGLTQKNFTTALDTKLGTIEASADVTDTTNVVAALTAGTNVTIAANGTISSTDTNTTYAVGDNGLTEKNFTTALDTKLGTIATSANNYVHPTDHSIGFIAGLQTALDAKAALASPALTGTPSAPTATAGTNTTQVATTQFVATAVGSGGGAQTGAQIKTAYEAEADTNAFNDAAVTKLGTIEASADVTDTTNVVAALTAGTNVAIAANGTISSTDTNTTYAVGDNGLTQKNFTTALDTKLGTIATSANNYVHPNHSGHVVSAADGATTIQPTVVTEAMLTTAVQTKLNASGGGGAVTASTYYLATVTSTAANINATGTVAWDNILSANANFSNAGGVITVGSAGRYKIHANLSMTTAVVRANIRLTIAVNGTTSGTASGQGGYIRNNSSGNAAVNHSETSVSVTDVIELNANDTIRIRTAQEAAPGTVNVLANTSRLIIEKLEVGTGAAAGNSSTTGKTLLSSDMNSTVNATGTVTVPNGVATAGDIVIVHNATGGGISITDGTITTMRLAGTATTGTRTLAQRGVAFLFFATATEVVVGGSGVS